MEKTSDTKIKITQFNDEQLPFLASGWNTYLKEEFTKPYMEDIRKFLRNDLKNGFKIFPKRENIFRALSLVDYNSVLVVILGQDPYHGENQANGLAFAVNNGVAAPPSLQNIFKEVESDLKIKSIKNTTLENWAKQGVLLLNTVLSVRANTPLSHRNIGWEVFTDKVIQTLNKKSTPIVYLLWGAAAQSKQKLITNKLHLVLKSTHPSPLSAHRGFLGCKHFSQVNNFLRANNIKEIDWLL